MKPLVRNYRWSLMFMEKGKPGKLIWDHRKVRMTPLLFRTREQARAFKRERYAYIAKRKDLRAPPFNWRSPKVVKVSLYYEVVSCT